MKRAAKKIYRKQRARNPELQAFGIAQDQRPIMASLYREAKARLRQRPRSLSVKAGRPASAGETQRLLHELQVHQVELEVQNAELQEGRERMEGLLEKYTDLYDFSPVGYFSLDESGRILEANLTGAAMLGAGRASLMNRRLSPFVAPANRADFLGFVAKVFAGSGKHFCEGTLLKEDGTSFWANFYGTAALSASTPYKWCRLVVSDITALKQAEEARVRLTALALANEELRQEIVRRQVIEQSLRQSELHQTRLLAQSQLLQEQLRHLSRQVLQAQEEERKEISRELHDVIAQTLTGINIRLATLKTEAARNPRGFQRNLARTQQLIEKSVDIVHRFARELRPAVLDDLGLIPALHSFLKIFSVRTGVRAHLKACTGLEQLDTACRTVLFRVAQEALTNVGRHAKATRVEVNITKLPNSIAMQIADDGKSFRVERTLHANGGKRLGLLGMRERVEMVGGAFGVESAPGKGTTIRVEIPLAPTPKPARKKRPAILK